MNQGPAMALPCVIITSIPATYFCPASPTLLCAEDNNVNKFPSFSEYSLIQQTNTASRVLFLPAAWTDI